jgi:ketosteroid isomerase-like protein
MTGIEIVMNFVKAINDHDVNKIYDLMSEDHMFVDGSGNKQQGREGMKEAWQDYYQIFPDYTIEISDLFEQKSTLGLFGYVRGTYKNIKASSNSKLWKTTAAWKAVVENQKIKHWQVYCDYSRLMQIINETTGD